MKKKKKSAFGWYQSFCPEEKKNNINPDAGNVPLNNEIFNQGFITSGSGVATSNISEDLNEAAQVDPTTPYMLRDDGKLLLCGNLHPYIVSDVNDSIDINYIENVVNNRSEKLDWFYKNTQSKYVRDLITQLKNYENNSLEDNISIITELNNLVNNEFCRVRMSHIKAPYGNNRNIYFRISKEDSKWNNLIYSTVSKYAPGIETVSISNDSQSSGEGTKWYKLNSTKVNLIPTKDFLTLSGDLLLENKISNNEQLYYQVAEKARNIFVNKYGCDFLAGHCIEATDYIIDELNKLGLSAHYVEGWVKADYGDDWISPDMEHNWTETDDGYIIDVTATQFNDAMETPYPEIIISKKLPYNYSYEEPLDYYNESLSSIEAIRRMRLEKYEI